jgi:tryptophan halogenase
MQIPETLKRRMSLFAEGGRFLRNEGELFPNASWVAVMLGQHVIPRAVDPFVAGMPASDIEPKLSLLRRSMNEYVEKLPTHAEFLGGYCASKAA